MIKRTALKHSTKPLKRTPIRKRSKSKATIDKADKLCQDCYRKLKLLCEVCGMPADLMHHFYPKSMSNHLRFAPVNMVALCRGCHFAHHRRGDPHIHSTIVSKRGNEWLHSLEEEKKVHRPAYTKKELEEIIKSYNGDI